MSTLQAFFICGGIGCLVMLGWDILKELRKLHKVNQCMLYQLEIVAAQVCSISSNYSLRNEDVLGHAKRAKHASYMESQRSQIALPTKTS